MTNKRNTSKDKQKRNKGYPYKKGGGDRSVVITNVNSKELIELFRKSYERIDKELEGGKYK